MREHEWFASFLCYDEDEPRWARCLLAFLDIVLIIFGNAIVCWYQFPAGLCERETERESCLRVKSTSSFGGGRMCEYLEEYDEPCTFKDLNPTQEFYSELQVLFIGVGLTLPLIKLNEVIGRKYLFAPTQPGLPRLPWRRDGGDDATGPDAYRAQRIGAARLLVNLGIGTEGLDAAPRPRVAANAALKATIAGPRAAHGARGRARGVGRRSRRRRTSGPSCGATSAPGAAAQAAVRREPLAPAFAARTRARLVESLRFFESSTTASRPRPPRNVSRRGASSSTRASCRSARNATRSPRATRRATTRCPRRSSPRARRSRSSSASTRASSTFWPSSRTSWAGSRCASLPTRPSSPSSRSRFSSSRSASSSSSTSSRGRSRTTSPTSATPLTSRVSTSARRSPSNPATSRSPRPSDPRRAARAARRPARAAASSHRRGAGSRRASPTRSPPETRRRRAAGLARVASQLGAEPQRTADFQDWKPSASRARTSSSWVSSSPSTSISSRPSSTNAPTSSSPSSWSAARLALGSHGAATPAEPPGWPAGDPLLARRRHAPLRRLHAA